MGRVTSINWHSLLGPFLDPGPISPYPDQPRVSPPIPKPKCPLFVEEYGEPESCAYCDLPRDKHNPPTILPNWANGPSPTPEA